MLKLILAVTLIATANTFAFETAPSMIFVGSTYSGHEEITRQALNRIAKKINQKKVTSFFDLADLSFDLHPEPRGLFGYKSKNLVIHGNFASDFPKQTSVLSLSDFWGIRRISDFDNPEYQVMHFLRNYKNSFTLESAKSTCLTARKNIKYATQEALKAWAQNDKSKALFLIGHATHTIQDSFSPAHTIRGGAETNFNLQNVCYFGNTMLLKIGINAADVCYHSAPDSRDTIWSTDNKQMKLTQSHWPNQQASQCDKNENYPESEEAKASCLDHHSRLAKLATEKYLFLVFHEMMAEKIVTTHLPKFINSLDAKLFDGPVGDSELDQKMAKGIMRCDGLSDQEIVGSEPIQGNH